MHTRRMTLIAGVCLTALLATGCGGDESSDGQATVEAPPSSAQATTSIVPLPGAEGGAFQLPVPGGDDNAFTYDEVAVPVGSTVTVDPAAAVA